MARTHAASVSADAGSPVATATAHVPMDVGEISLTNGKKPAKSVGMSMTAKPIPAIPAALLMNVPRPIALTIQTCRLSGGGL